MLSNWDEISFDEEDIEKAAAEIRERNGIKYGGKIIGKTTGPIEFRTVNMVHDAIWTTVNAESAEVIINANIEELLSEYNRSSRMPEGWNVPLRTEPDPGSYVVWDHYEDVPLPRNRQLYGTPTGWTINSPSGSNYNIAIGYSNLDRALSGGLQRGEYYSVVSSNPMVDDREVEVTDPLARHRRRDTYPHTPERLDRNSGGCYTGRTVASRPNLSNIRRSL